MELVAEVEAQFAAQVVLVLVLVQVQVQEEVHEEVEAQEAVVEMADVLGIADEGVKVVLEVLEAQVLLEAQEVQDHPSCRLLPDHAALAHLGRRPEVQHRLGLQGHQCRPEAGQRH